MRRYKANFLLAYCQGNSIRGLNSGGGEGDFVTGIISFPLCWKLTCVCKFITKGGFRSEFSKGRACRSVDDDAISDSRQILVIISKYNSMQ